MNDWRIQYGSAFVLVILMRASGVVQDFWINVFAVFVIVALLKTGYTKAASWAIGILAVSILGALAYRNVVGLNTYTQEAIHTRSEHERVLMNESLRAPGVASEQARQEYCTKEELRLTNEQIGELIEDLNKQLPVSGPGPAINDPTRLTTELRWRVREEALKIWRKKCMEGLQPSIYSEVRNAVVHLRLPATALGVWWLLGTLLFVGSALYTATSKGSWYNWFGAGALLLFIMLGGHLFIDRVLPKFDGIEELGKALKKEWAEWTEEKEPQELTLRVSASNPGDLRTLLKADEGKRVTMNFVRDATSYRSELYPLPKCAGKRIRAEVTGGPWNVGQPVLVQFLGYGNPVDFREIPAPYFEYSNLPDDPRGKLPIVPLKDLEVRLAGGGRVTFYQSATLTLWCEPI